MVIKVKKNWKDFIESGTPHKGISRRDFIMRGLATSSISMLVPSFISSIAKAAPADCPAPALVPGMVAQIYEDGGNTRGATGPLGDDEAAIMNATMAGSYGIGGQADLVKLGPNFNISRTSVFGFVLMQGPPGFPGGPAAWQANVLSQCSAGGHRGPFNADDGGGNNRGNLGGAGALKPAKFQKDILISGETPVTKARFATGIPQLTVNLNNGGDNLNGLTTARFSNGFSLTPASNGLTTSAELINASDASYSLAGALASAFKLMDRKGGATLLKNAACAFSGNAQITDPNFAINLFNPNINTALTGVTTVANLSAQEQALLSAGFRSADGNIGAVVVQLGGRDYHGNGEADITRDDAESARAVVMFLTACFAANSRGCIMNVSNGQAIANGTRDAVLNVNGVAATGVLSPIATADAGGTNNRGWGIFFTPKSVGAPVSTKWTGTVDANGRAVSAPEVASVPNAMAGLYLSAFMHNNGGSVPVAAETALKAAGIASPRSLLIL